MGNTIKRNKIFCHLKSFNPDVIFLQETHLKINHHTRLRNTWIGQVYHSNSNHNSRGVATLFRKGAQFDHTKTIKDPNCRFIMLIGKLCNSPIILVNIYGPNWDDPQFFLLNLLPLYLMIHPSAYHSRRSKLRTTSTIR